MISRSLLTSVAASAMLVLASAAFTTPQAAAEQAHPQQIAFNADQTYAESVTWSAKQNIFFVSSVRHGTVGKLALDGKYTPFITDEKLVSSVGLLVDDQRNTLWVTNSDPGAGDRTSAATQGKLAGVAAYDATTGERRAYYDLGSLSAGTHFANDVALDNAGNLYVTDSFAPVIYRITPDGKTSIFAQNPMFGDADGFNLNGIAWHSDGYLLVGKYNSGELFRVNVAGPTHVDKVQLPEALKGADGFHLVDGQHLIVVQNLGVDRTLELKSTDGWKSAQLVRQQKSVMSMPTAATGIGNDVYVLDSRIDTLFDPKAAKVSDYLLQKF
jgi:sugar lactone lactonase YvrE